MMFEDTSTMEDFSTKQGFLFYSFPLCEEEKEKIDGFLTLLDRSGVAELIWEKAKKGQAGRPSYDPYKLFSAVLLGFALGSPSLREIESSCRNDLRFIYALGGEAPDHTTVSRFINDVILPQKDELFSRIMKAIFDSCGIAMDTAYIDGTKMEADANRYKFVWKPTGWHRKLDGKTRSLLSVMGLADDLPAEGLLPSSLVARKLEKAKQHSDSSKAWTGMMSNLTSYLLKMIEYEEKETICGPHRNSYYKSDHDATAMCLKQDYYSGLGSSMHAAYSVQFMTSQGFIVSYLVSQDRSDMYTLTKTIDAFHAMYGMYPKRICADSGYGCTENWGYCHDHGIRGFIKYNSWSGERSGRNPAVYELEADDTITCLGGRKGYVTKIPSRHPKKKGAVFYRVDGCDGCAFMPYCRRFMDERTGHSKVFEVSPDYQRYKQEARDMLLSVEGIEMRVNRSIQVEGAFGCLKQDMAYARLRRTSLEKATLEVMLSCLGFNIRKYMRFVKKRNEFKEWKAPKETKPETFKKPSAKRLANRTAKLQKKSKNEQVRNSHKYKKTQKEAASKD